MSKTKKYNFIKNKILFFSINIWYKYATWYKYLIDIIMIIFNRYDIIYIYIYTTWYKYLIDMIMYITIYISNYSCNYL